MKYDAVERHREVETRVIQKKRGGDLKKYARFRPDRWYGGVITADCVGCGLDCRFCWARKDAQAESGEFYSPREVAEKVLQLCKEKRISQIRISGGEPTIGREHLMGVLNALQNKRVRFVLETNGILIGADETYAQELALYPFVHVRVSLKGCSEEEFAMLTGADPRGFQLQISALMKLVKAGVSTHPAVMISFSGKESIDRLYNTIWKIDPRMHSEVEREEIILYPHVIERLRRAGLKVPEGRAPDRNSRDRDR